jgi:hypothetical protein
MGALRSPPPPAPAQQCTGSSPAQPRPVITDMTILLMAAEEGPRILFLHAKQDPVYPIGFSGVCSHAKTHTRTRVSRARRSLATHLSTSMPSFSISVSRSPKGCQ